MDGVQPVPGQSRSTVCPEETLRVIFGQLGFPPGPTTDTVYVPGDTMKVTFVIWFAALPLIVTVAPVGSDLITSVAGWGGICGVEVRGSRRTKTTTSANDNL
jgi:hypothetical protein